MLGFYRGSTPVIKVRPLNGVNVDALGDIRVAMKQDLVFYSASGEDLTVDASANLVSFKLPYRDSLRFVPNEPVQLQMVGMDDSGNVMVFPIKELTVYETIVQIDDDVDVSETTESTITQLDADWGL